MNEWYVEQETGEDEDGCIQVLDFGVIDDRPNNQVNRYDQNDNRNCNWNLKFIRNSEVESERDASHH